MIAMVFTLQVAAPLPTIEFKARVEAREVIVEQRGVASLTMRAEPDGGSRVEVVERPGVKGQRVIRGYRANIDASATVADPQQAPVASTQPAQEETSPRNPG